MVNILLSLAIAALAAFPLNYQKEIVNGLTEKNISPEGLLWLGAAMGGVITLSLALKWVLGYLSSVLGEDMIRKLRKRICNLSRENSAGSETVAYGAKATMVSAEAEQVGKFSGSALSEPIVQAGTLVVIVGCQVKFGSDGQYLIGTEFLTQRCFENLRKKSTAVASAKTASADAFAGRFSFHKAT